MLSVEEYQMMEVEYNNKPFLQLVDTDNTKASIYYIRQVHQVCLQNVDLDTLVRFC